MTTKTNTDTTETFTCWDPLDGKEITFKRTEKGYCFRDGKRIKAAEFQAAKVEAARQDGIRAERMAAQAARVRAAVERSEEPSRQDYEERKEEMNIIEIDGVEWANDHLNKKVYRDGVKCTRQEFDRAIRAANGEDEVKPARKPRRSKDVAFEAETTEGVVTLTAKQADFLRELHDAGEATLGCVESGWWTDCITDAIGGQFACSPMTVGAMISTLCEKGLGERTKEQRETAKGRTKKVTSFHLTQKGREVWEAMGF